ncbi:GNAT family N-acetyltransferase [Aquimarina sp. TRL1]|uniref:GNAT family N-acetyltransferase n=1 Tax=Aquimarina sp. (strain TRL1) TaxID=2736252 RepID=UPI00158F0E5B|nr:GNAT family N-acetyltransferase [Aquimarina sp. TRL1]QKX07097.1 GNAT family N-acetyltransferase [Aquimarina sp. TRL1]
MRIRPVEKKEAEQLRVIGIATFEDTYGSLNTPENMKIYLEKNFSKKQLLKELDNPDSKFYFLEEQEKVLGYLKINVGSSQTEYCLDEALEVERIYILSIYQGRGYGSKLLDKAVEIAKTAGVKNIWLGVWEKNLKAINFYQKNGFVVFHTHIFKLGDEEQTDLLMKKVILDE